MSGELAERAFKPEQVELLKRTVAKGTTDDELKLFLHVCEKAGLDPFSKQIYAIKRKNRRTNVEEMSIQTGIDGYRVVAERTGQYAPGKEPDYQYDKDGTLISATAHVNKFVAGKWFEISATAFLKEYVQEGNFMWGKMPHVMLAKCAEALALRRAFPNELSGLYTNEEMAQADSAVRMPERKTSAVPAEPHEPQKQTELSEILGPEDEAPARPVPAPHLKHEGYNVRLPEDEVDIPFGAPHPAGYKERLINRGQQQLLFIMAREAGITDEQVKKAIDVLYNITSTSKLTNAQFENVLTLIKKGGIRATDPPKPTAA